MSTVSEIVEKYHNKGLKDKIYAESFLAYMTEESSLEEVIVKNINKSLLPQTKATSDGRFSRLKQVMSLDYIQNNRNHLITSLTFLSIPILSMIVRATQFIGRLLRPQYRVDVNRKGFSIDSNTIMYRASVELCMNVICEVRSLWLVPLS